MNNTQNTPGSPLQKEDTIDIKKFIFKILSNWYWFIFTVSIAVFSAYLVNRYTDPIYTVKATMIVQDKDNTLSGGVESILEEQGLFRRTRKKVVENEIAILQSYSLSRRAIEESPEFHISYFSEGRIRTVESYKANTYIIEPDTNFENKTEIPVYVRFISDEECIIATNNESQKTTVKFGEWFENEDFRFKIRKNDSLATNSSPVIKTFFIIRDINKLTNAYRSKLSLTTTDKKSTIVEISTSGTVAKKEVDFINKLMDVYVRKGLEEKNIIAINTINFIDEQLNDITDSLKFTEDKLRDFRQTNRLVDISQEGSMLYQKVERVQTEKAMLNMKNKYYNYLLEYISKEQDFSDVMAPSVVDINDAMLSGLIADLTELYKEKNNYNYSSNKSNPGIELVNYKIQNTISTLKENIRNILKSNEIGIAETNRRMGEIDAEISQLPSTEKELIGIKRRYKLNDDIYTYLLTKRSEAGIAKASNVPDNKILDIAREDNAALISPKKSLNYAIALIIGILIPVLIILMLDFFNDKIVERKDIEETTSIPILGEIGHNDKETDMVVLEKPKSSIAESFRTLRTNIQYFNIDMADKTRVISITSTISGEGKSFCAINLASIFALGDKKTLLMGIDLRKPKLHRELNLENIKGLSTYLVGTHTLDEVILPTHQNNLFFMPAGPVPPNPAELIETTKMVNLVNLLKEKFDMIIMDTPPIALVTDALLLAKYSDINLFVIRQNYSRKNMVRLINELFAEKGFKNVGIVINDIKIHGYYGYNYYGNYGYGKYGYRYGYGRYGYGDSSGYYEDDHENGSTRKGGFISGLFKKKK